MFRFSSEKDIGIMLTFYYVHIEKINTHTWVTVVNIIYFKWTFYIFTLLGTAEMLFL